MSIMSRNVCYGIGSLRDCVAGVLDFCRQDIVLSPIYSLRFKWRLLDPHHAENEKSDKTTDEDSETKSNNPSSAKQTEPNSVSVSQ